MGGGGGPRLDLRNYFASNTLIQVILMAFISPSLIVAHQADRPSLETLSYWETCFTVPCLWAWWWSEGMPSQINNFSVLSSASQTYCLLLDTAEAVSTVISSQRTAQAARPTLNHDEENRKSAMHGIIRMFGLVSNAVGTGWCDFWLCLKVEKKEIDVKRFKDKATVYS